MNFNEKLNKIIKINNLKFGNELSQRNKIIDIINKYKHKNREELSLIKDINIFICGRILANRSAGKASFLNIFDFTGKIQIYVRSENLNNDEQFCLNNINIGDIIYCSGSIMKTRTGELTIKITKFVLLAKSLMSFPDKFKGLKDKEQRHRLRFLDLLLNSDSKDKIIKRIKIIKLIRKFLDNLDFLEFETPILNKNYGGAFAIPFVTRYHSLKADFYLRIATEIPLKKLIVSGFDKVYEIGKLFRNEGISAIHNPEFTSIEIYEAYANLNDMKKLCINLFIYLIKNIHGEEFLNINDKKVFFKKENWITMTMNEAVKKYTNIDFSKIKNYKEAIKIASKMNVKLLKHQNSKGHILDAFFNKFVEKKIINPTFITEYPIEISTFAKKIPGNKDYTQRFELFIAGKEFANAFNEINSADEQN